MATLTAQGLAKSYGGRELFSDVSFEVSDGSKLAVVGPNGYGKSTLLRIVAGEMAPDTGQISVPKGVKIGYAAQELQAPELDRGLLTWVLEVFPSWGDFWSRWEQAVASGDEAAVKRLGAEQARLEQSFGYNLEHQAEAVLSGLGFAPEKFNRPLKELSGGWRERAKLARVLLAGADVLLLDEPTNHLDLEAVEWLEQYLLDYKGALVFVVHDRVFLDRVASHVLAFGPARPIFRKGNFTDYLAWQDESAVTRERQAAKLAAKIEDQMEYVRRFRVKARKASQAQSKLKAVEKLKTELAELTPERRRRTLSFSLPEPSRAGKLVAYAKDLVYGYDARPSLWPALSFQVYRGQKIALAGPNGAGKSTLLRLLVGDLQPRSGEAGLGPLTELGYYSQHQADVLDPTRTVLGQIRAMSDPNLREEQLKGVLGLFMLGEEYFDRPTASLSGGEKSRLVLASLFLVGANLLVLDEPTNHLDLESREALVEALSAYEGTLVMVAHDRYLINEVAEEVWGLTGEGLVSFDSLADYEAQRKALPVLPGQAEVAAQAAPPRLKRKLDKEEKRRQAEVRNRIGRELNPKKQAYAECEAKLEALMAEQGELEAKLADPATYQKTDDFMRLTTTYQQTKVREEELLERMSGLEEEIAELEARRGELLEAEE